MLFLYHLSKLIIFLLITTRRIDSRDNLNYSPFNCGTTSWKITFDDNELAAQNFQDWLLYWQFSCGSHSVNHKNAHNGGLGSSFMFASKYFMEALELKQIYRPDHGNIPWLWSDPNPMNCTLHKQSYDCFCEPISDCDYNTNINERSCKLLHDLQHIHDRMDDNVLKAIDEGLMDVCTFGSILQKPVKWIHGQLMLYLTRPRDDVYLQILQRKEKIFANLPFNNQNNISTVTIGFQVRSGPLDDGREPITNLTEVLTVIDSTVHEIETKHGQIVSMVFLCGDIPEMTYQSAEYMNTNHKRSFEFRTTHHLNLGQDDAEKTLRSSNNNNNNNNKLPSRFDLFVDFMTDIEILANVDYLIGSKSNVYMVAALYRYARQLPNIQLPKNTCYVDKSLLGKKGGEHQQKNDPNVEEIKTIPLICEGSEEAIRTWYYYFNPYYTHFESYPL
jgi:hypothetical protein